MSYQSKYTGNEIDALLDQIGSSASKITELGDFNYSSTQTSGAFQPNVTATLNDSIENYDFIFVQIGGVTDSSGSDKTYATDNMIYVPSVVARGYTNPEAKGYNIGCHWADKYLSGYVYFLSPTELKIGWAAVKTYCYLTAGKIYGIKLNGSAADTTPVGTVISVMRKKAPEGYLICDGRELNIADYKALADMFEEEFGSKNVYGGDGITTFAIPDLRNEFLRGYYGDKEEQLSGEIGEHQDGTLHTRIGIHSNAAYIYRDSSLNSVDWGDINGDNRNQDDIIIASSKNIRYGSIGTVNTATSEQQCSFTSRPTNVAVLYCIKY